MSDLKLDTTTEDLEIGPDGDLILTSGKEAIEQHLKQRLRTFLGEWFLERRTGIPYFEQVLIKAFNPTVLDGIFKNVILNTPGVTELQEFDILLDTSTREMNLTFRVDTIDGDFDFSEPLGVI